ncbi:MAG: alpha-galactosidase [Lachnospiraceae bacterium]|nr:alpha-galactosidase [Lachnospiraceae bacterium]
MIRVFGSVFVLETSRTSYIFRVMETGHLEHLYYGSRIEVSEGDDLTALFEKKKSIPGTTIAYSENHGDVSLEDVCLEMSAYGKGDVREPFICVVHPDGSRTSDFLYKSYEIRKKTGMNTLPSSYDEKGETDELVITLKDKSYDLVLELIYSTFDGCDVIARRAVFLNHSKGDCRLERLMSLQLDLDVNDYTFTNFTGAWGREMDRHDFPCHQGRIVSSSYTGTSSNRANPFVMLHEPYATEEKGECFGFNLVYSGNHFECAETSSTGKLRVLTGINPEGFEFCIEPDGCFESPEAFMTFSDGGFRQMSLNMHHFIREHIVRGTWKYRERPILINSWEAAFFNITEKRLTDMAKKASEAGIELFVMDDGWFGNRNDDTSSLGDWTVNRKKLPGGLLRLSNKIHSLGMSFGIWVEPEMVNEKSRLFEAHPDWALKIPKKHHSLGRNQMVLDLTREDVRKYIIDSMKAVFSSAKIEYVKWDMNRIFTDVFSQALPAERQGEVFHRYVCGLYEILGELVKEFPDILFEACSSGGNRFDPGILCSMPQIWASDDTDAYERAKIQTGVSYGYPQSVCGSHVSNCPNIQTLRTTPIETRFNVAAFGCFGYELNIGELGKDDFEAIKAQVKLYKTYRKTLQFGDYYRLNPGEDTDYSKGSYSYMAVSADRKQAVGVILNGLTRPNYTYTKFRGAGLEPDKLYRFRIRPFKYSWSELGDLIYMVSPVHLKVGSLRYRIVEKKMRMESEVEDYVVRGSLINNAGIKLKQSYGGTGMDSDMKVFKDFYSRMYLMDRQ